MCIRDSVGGRLIGAQDVLGAQRGLHRLVEPGRGQTTEHTSCGHTSGSVPRTAPNVAHLRAMFDDDSDRTVGWLGVSVTLVLGGR